MKSEELVDDLYKGIKYSFFEEPLFDNLRLINSIDDFFKTLLIQTIEEKTNVFYCIVQKNNVIEDNLYFKLTKFLSLYEVLEGEGYFDKEKIEKTINRFWKELGLKKIFNETKDFISLPARKRKNYIKYLTIAKRDLISEKKRNRERFITEVNNRLSNIRLYPQITERLGVTENIIQCFSFLADEAINKTPLYYKIIKKKVEIHPSIEKKELAELESEMLKLNNFFNDFEDIAGLLKQIKHLSLDNPKFINLKTFQSYSYVWLVHFLEIETKQRRLTTEIYEKLNYSKKELKRYLLKGEFLTDKEAVNFFYQKVLEKIKGKIQELNGAAEDLLCIFNKEGKTYSIPVFK